MEQQNNNNETRITDKAFSRAMITSVLGILVCIMCLCSATWAWFSTDISNDSNTVGSGNFGLIVTVTDVTDGGTEVSVPVSVTEDGASVCTLEGGKTYKVILKMTADTTVSKGFCSITSSTNPTVTLQSGSVNVDTNTNPFEFTLTVDGTGARSVTFDPAWGYPANAKVEHLGTLGIS